MHSYLTKKCILNCGLSKPFNENSEVAYFMATVQRLQKLFQ